jgi:3-oxoacyl-[acyl-carrier-protein] synthase-3
MSPGYGGVVGSGPAAAPIGIGAIHCLLPATERKVGTLAELPALGEDEAEFALHSGIETVGVFEGRATAGLAAEAIRGLPPAHLTDTGLLLLVGPRSPDVLLGSDAGQVQAEAGIASAFAFTVDGLGCVGSSAAWAIARVMLVADAARGSAVIAYASRPTGADRVRYPVTVIGDGAYAMTLVPGGRPVLRAHRMETDGSFHDLFRVDYKPVPWYEWREECSSVDRYRFELAMQGRQRLVRMLDEALAEAGLRKGDVTATVMQNITSSAFDFYQSMLGLPIHPLCRDHLAAYGHLGAMDVVLNLDRLLASGSLRTGDHVLVLNSSPAAAWAVTLWEV